MIESTKPLRSTIATTLTIDMATTPIVKMLLNFLHRSLRLLQLALSSLFEHAHRASKQQRRPSSIPRMTFDIFQPLLDIIRALFHTCTKLLITKPHTTKEASRSRLCPNKMENTTTCHITMLDSIPELFEMFILACPAQSRFALRQVCKHWATIIDSSSTIQESLFLSPRHIKNVLQLKPDQPKVTKYLVTGIMPLSRIPKGDKFCVPVEMNTMVCERTERRNIALQRKEIEKKNIISLERRISLGEWIKLKDDIVEKWMENFVKYDGSAMNLPTDDDEEDDIMRRQIMEQNDEDDEDNSEEEVSKTQLGMFLTQPPVKSAFIDFLKGSQRVTNPGGLRLRDIFVALEATRGLWSQLLASRGRVGGERRCALALNLSGAFDPGVEGVVFMGEGDWKEVKAEDMSEQ